jgi:hypothetical protein
MICRNEKESHSRSDGSNGPSKTFVLVDRWIAGNVPAGFRAFGSITAEDARLVRAQAPAASPVPQPLDRLGRRDRDRHDVLGRLEERQVQERGQPAAGPDLGARPALVGRPLLLALQLEVLQVDARGMAGAAEGSFSRLHKQNRSLQTSRGSVRQGRALLSGLIVCGRCGYRLGSGSLRRPHAAWTAAASRTSVSIVTMWDMVCSSERTGFSAEALTASPVAPVAGPWA